MSISIVGIMAISKLASLIYFKAGELIIIKDPRFQIDFFILYVPTGVDSPKHLNLKMLFISKILLVIAYLHLFAGCSAQAATASTAANNVSGQGLPNPTDSPSYPYTFQLRFHKTCTSQQQETLRKNFNNAAGLADRVIELWKSDAFHDWSNDMNNWMGKGSGDNVAYIKSTYPHREFDISDSVGLIPALDNFLRLSAAIKPFYNKDSKGNYLNNGGDVWINTYLYVGCGYNWGYYDLGCWNGKTGGIMAKNNYGFFRQWVIISRKIHQTVLETHTVTQGQHLLEYLSRLLCSTGLSDASPNSNERPGVRYTRYGKLLQGTGNHGHDLDLHCSFHWDISE